MNDIVPIEDMPQTSDIVPAHDLPDTLFGRAKKAVTNLAISTARNAAPLAFAAAPLFPESTKRTLSDFYDQTGEFLKQNQPTPARGIGDRIVDTASTIAPLVGMGPAGAASIINNALTGTATEETEKGKSLSDIVGKTALKTAAAGGTLLLPVGGVLKTAAGSAGAVGIANAERVLENNLESDPTQQRAFNATDDILMPVATQLGFGTVAHLQAARQANKLIDTVAGKLEKDQYVPDTTILKAKNAANVYIRPAKELAALQRIKDAEVSSDNILNEKMGAHVVSDIVPSSDLPHSETLPPATDATVVRQDIKPIVADSETDTPIITGPQRQPAPDIQIAGSTYKPKAAPPAPSQMQIQGLQPNVLQRMFPEWALANGLTQREYSRPTHDDLAGGIPASESLAVQDTAPALKPVVKGTRDEILALKQQGAADGKVIHTAGDTAYIIDPNAVQSVYGGSKVEAINKAKLDLKAGGDAESKLLGYPDREGLTPDQTIDVAVTKTGEVVTDLPQMKTEKEAGNIAWAAEGKPEDVTQKAEAVSSAIQGKEKANGTEGKTSTTEGQTVSEQGRQEGLLKQEGAAPAAPIDWQNVHTEMIAPQHNTSTKVKGVSGPTTDSMFTKVFSQIYPSLFYDGNNPQAKYNKSDIQATVKNLAKGKTIDELIPKQQEIAQHLADDINNLQEIKAEREAQSQVEKTVSDAVELNSPEDVSNLLAELKRLREERANGNVAREPEGAGDVNSGITDKSIGTRPEDAQSGIQAPTETIDESGWKQQVGIEGDSKPPVIGQTQKQGGRAIGTSELLDGFTPDPQTKLDLHAGIHLPTVLKLLREAPGIKPVLDSIQSLIHPESLMPQDSRDAFFKLKGERNQANDLLAQKLAKASKAGTLKQAAANFLSAEKTLKQHFDRQTPEQHLAFYDKVRTGRVEDMTPQEAKLYAIGTQLDGMFASRVRELFPDFPLRENHAMFTLKWDQNVSDSPFPGVSARLEGDKGFTKKYSGNLASDIAANGLTLRESNPVKVLQKSWNDHVKFLSAATYAREAVDTGRMIYETKGNRPPKGMEAVPDKFANVFKRIMFPEEVKSSEHIDKSVYNGLLAVAKGLGIKSVTRPVKMGGSQLGDYSPGFDAVRTKANTETSVLAHEIGHAIDQPNDLWSRIVTEATAEGKRGKVTKSASQAARITIKEELRSIADIMAGPRGAGTSYTHKRVEQIAQMVEAYVHAPEQMKEVAPAVFKAFDEYVKSKPELKALSEIQPGIQLTSITHNIKVPKPVYAKSFNVIDAEGNVLAKFPQKDMATRALDSIDGADKIKVQIGIPNSVQAGTWYLPKAESMVLGRYLKSDPMHTNPILSGLLEVKGMDTSLELLGLFHFVNIGNEAVRSKAANIIRGGTEEANIRSGWGMKKLSELANSGELQNNPEAVAELQRAGFTPEEFKGYVDGFYRGGGKLENVNRDLGGPIAESWNKLTAKVPLLKTLNVAHDAVFSVTDQLFHKFVPDLKLSAYISAMKTSERVYADRLASGEMSKTQLERDTVKHIENVFGELNYENLMLPKAFKSALQLVFRAPGWNIGTWRAVPDAFRQGINEINRSIEKGERPVIPLETSWLLSTVALHVAEATILGYTAAKLTGDDSLKPKEWVDYFFPKLSFLTRVTPPGYLKDIFSMGMDISKSPFYMPLNFLQSKLAGVWSRGIEVYRNKNYYGTQIRDENSNPAQQAWDVAKHLAPKPIFAKSIMEQQSKGDDSPGVAAASILGYPKAPAWVNKSKLGMYLDAHVPRMDTSVSPEEADHRHAVSAMVHKIQTLQSAGKPLDDVVNQTRQLLQAGKITEKDLKAIDKKLSTDPLVERFRRLSATDAIKAFNDVADDTERKQVTEAFGNKMDKLFEDQPELAKALMPRIMKSVEHIRRLQ